MSTILIENVLSEHIVFQGNLFKNNVGLDGGAIHINNHLHDLHYSDRIKEIRKNKLAPVILFKNNTFEKNMAYFEGNAIFITKGNTTEHSNREKFTVMVNNCTFK